MMLVNAHVNNYSCLMGMLHTCNTSLVMTMFFTACSENFNNHLVWRSSMEINDLFTSRFSYTSM